MSLEFSDLYHATFGANPQCLSAHVAECKRCLDLQRAAGYSRQQLDIWDSADTTNMQEQVSGLLWGSITHLCGEANFAGRMSQVQVQFLCQSRSFCFKAYL